jgi:hypothetical protein
MSGNDIGIVYDRLYHVWKSMIHRCTNPKNPAYKYYGGKGICVCQEWLIFEAFFNWAITNGYRQNLTIDRIDSNGDYMPGNCEWVTRNFNSSRAMTDTWQNKHGDMIAHWQNSQKEFLSRMKSRTK